MNLLDFRFASKAFRAWTIAPYSIEFTHSGRKHARQLWDTHGIRIHAHTRMDEFYRKNFSIFCCFFLLFFCRSFHALLQLYGSTDHRWQLNRGLTQFIFLIFFAEFPTGFQFMFFFSSLSLSLPSLVVTFSSTRSSMDSLYMFSRRIYSWKYTWKMD